MTHRKRVLELLAEVNDAEDAITAAQAALGAAQKEKTVAEDRLVHFLTEAGELPLRPGAHGVIPLLLLTADLTREPK